MTVGRLVVFKLRVTVCIVPLRALKVLEMLEIEALLSPAFTENPGMTLDACEMGVPTFDQRAQ